MARDSDDGEDPAEDGEDRADASHEPRECMPCRGTGQVISNLGGTPSSVSCPWCGGGGVRLAEVDAQTRWKQDAGEDQAPEAAAAGAADGAVLRTFGVGAQILKDLGVKRMRVLSAPKQMHGLSAFGLEVEGYVGEEG